MPLISIDYKEYLSEDRSAAITDFKLKLFGMTLWKKTMISESYSYIEAFSSPQSITNNTLYTENNIGFKNDKETF